MALEGVGAEARGQRERAAARPKAKELAIGQALPVSIGDDGEKETNRVPALQASADPLGRIRALQERAFRNSATTATNEEA